MQVKGKKYAKAAKERDRRAKAQVDAQKRVENHGTYKGVFAIVQTSLVYPRHLNIWTIVQMFKWVGIAKSKLWPKMRKDGCGYS